MTDLETRLKAFVTDERMTGKGPLCVGLVVTRHALKCGLPLNADELVTAQRGQVKGLGKASVQAILKDHGIMRVLAEEGGRTSRGSIGHMQKYVRFLNSVADAGSVDLREVECWWIEEVKKYFAGKPFVLRFDSSKSLRAMIRDLLDQAQRRQSQGSGTMFLGTVMQHLVGAKLDLVLGGIEHHGASVADEGSGRDCDFPMGDVAIHVTTSPSEALIRKCGRNLNNSLRPLILTTEPGATLAKGLAKNAGLEDRIDVLDVEQFLASNLYEHGRFESAGRRESAEAILNRYNEVVEKHETDPSLRITFGK